jgi:arylsulfatase A-like enzyme
MPDSRYIDARRLHGAFDLDERAERPDIFVITIDMVPPEAWRPGPCRAAMRLPALDRLQAESATFTNAFCTAPLCGPSRAAMLTGRYSYVTVNEERAHDGQEYALRREDVIFPEYLRAAGYVTRHVGKCHVGAAKFIDAFGENAHPWDRWAPPIHDDDEYHQYLEDLGVRGWRATREICGLRPDRRTPLNTYGAWVEQEDGRPFPVEATYSHYLARRAARTLRTLRHRTGRGRLIYLQLDFFDPHQPFFIPSGLEEREAALRRVVEPPASWRRWIENGCAPLPEEPRIYQTYRLNHGLYREEIVRDYMVANLLQMEILDGAIGVFLDALREEGLYDTALTLLTADHGEMNGEGSLVDKGVYGHPKVARVPLMVRTGGDAQGTVESAVSLLDVAPTVLHAAGLRPRAPLDGYPLQPMLAPGARRPREDFLFEAGWHVAPNPAAAVQHLFPDGRRFWYVYNLSDRCDELYDLADPAYRNLARDPAHSETRREMQRRLAAVLRGDARWRCYWHAFRVEHGDLVGDSGDRQMFVPE